jgi:hypothetical protein
MSIVRNPLCFLLICSIATLSGCSGDHGDTTPRKISQGNYDKVEEGMTEAEVTNILGPPSNRTSASVSRTDPKTGTSEQSNSQMSWSDGVRSITIDFINGKVSGKKQHGL